MRFSAFSAAVVLLALAAGSRLAAGGCAAEDLAPASKAALEHYSAGRYRDAVLAFEDGARQAAACGDKSRELRFLNGAAGSLFASYRYLEALRAYQSVARTAEARGDQELAAVAALNLSSLYTVLWEPAAAAEALQKAAKTLPPDSVYRPKLLAQQMFLAARRREASRARELGLEAARLADAAGDNALVAQVWDRLGRLELGAGRLEAAEEWLTAAFRLRKLLALPHLESSYQALGRLRLAQGRAQEALTLMAAGSAIGRASPSLGPPWVALYETGLALRAVGRDGGALETLERAWGEARKWRAGLLPAQWMLAAADVGESQVAGEFADLAATLAARGGRQELARRAVAAVEAGRASSLRSVALEGAWRQSRLPAAFGDALAGLRDAELRRLRGTPGAAEAAETWRGRLSALEAEAEGGLPDEPGRGHAFQDVRRALQPDEALFTFLVGAERTWVWVVTTDGFGQHALPGRAALEARVASFRAALQQDPPPADDGGAALFRDLFGWAERHAGGKRHWVLSLDDTLFHLPVGALRAGTAYVAERHTLALTPSIHFRARGADRTATAGLLAVGDCVYNRADSRFVSQRERSGAGGWSVLPRLRANANEFWELPRLVGSGAELRSVGDVFRAQGAQVRVLSGLEARVDALGRALEQGAGVVHLAVHVLPGAPGTGGMELLRVPGTTRAVRRPDEMFLALSLTESGAPDVLPASMVAGRMNVPGSLVVLSGCHSGGGTVLPGAGLQGFTQAWLAAGARGVVGSLWPVTDDGGQMFEAFYKQIAAGETPREALRRAQTGMIRSGNWRARPSHWAAYVLVGRE